MSALDYEQPQAAPPTDGPETPDRIEKTWQSRIQDAENYRRQFEPTWMSNLAFVEGKQWLVYDQTSRTLRHISEVDPAYANRDLYVADVITEHRTAAVGELQSDDDRPELLLPGNGEESENDEDIAQHANRAVGHAWDYEIHADEQLLDVRRKCVDLGVGAIRCRFDPTAGPEMQAEAGPVQAPVHKETGLPIADPEKARAYVADLAAKGDRAQFVQLHEGRIRWEVGSALNILAPPGVPHERDFPWEIWVRPVDLDNVREEYGAAAAKLTEDTDIASVLGVGVKQQERNGGVATDGQPVKLRNHVWLYTCYERPTRKYPRGRVTILAGAGKTFVKQIDQLPYQAPDGTWRSGIAYFHWWRLNNRFYSRSLIESLKDPQRMINRRKTQAGEIIDRGMPFIVLEEDTLVENRTGTPLELVKLKKGTTVQPQVQGGVGPGEWMYRDVQEMREDLAHASTLSPLRLGENPQNVDTYSQLALLNENEQVKRQHILFEHKLAIKKLVEDTLCDVRRYWPEGKQLVVAGDDNRVQAVRFLKSQVPDFYVITVAKGAAKPRSQAAELKKIEDIWQAAIACGAFQASPQRWIAWFKESLDQGQPLDLPLAETDEQTDKASLENAMLAHGEEVAVAYYDLAPVHIPIHRGAQDEALMSGDGQAWERIEMHVQEHLQQAAANAARVASLTPPPASAPAPAQPQPQQPQPAQPGQ